MQVITNTIADVKRLFTMGSWRETPTTKLKLEPFYPATHGTWPT